MIPRIQRFPIHVPMRYRACGENYWRDARTENISRTGVLFNGEQLLGLNAPVEMRFEMVLLPPLETAGVAVVVCRGNIVRATHAQEKAARPALAATIADYRFVPGKNGLKA